MQIFHMTFNDSTTKICLTTKNLALSHIVRWSLGMFAWCLNIFFTRIFVPVKMKIILGVKTQEALLASYTAL